MLIYTGNILFWLAIVTLALTSAAALMLYRGSRTIRNLRDTPVELPEKPPRVSIVVAARNEERNLEEALRSLLGLSYPDYELIVVNDRSEDGTGAILHRLAGEHPQLQVVEVTELPPGWLGKNHALWSGSNMATGDLLLFTDADVVMHPDLLNRAVNYLTTNRLDHLALTPAMRMPSVLLGMFGASFIIYFSLFVRPWQARNPASSCHIGIGAFNMIKTDLYRAVGGHERIRLRPDDDIKLGKIVKMAGCRQDVACAWEFMAVEWYASLGEVVRGLEKNAFSGADYNILLILSGSLFHLLFSIWPFVAVLVLSGTTQAIYAVAVLLILVTFADTARFHGSKSWYALGYPVMTALFVFILLRTMTLNLRQGGISWRGTFYTLDELKRNRI